MHRDVHGEFHFLLAAVSDRQSGHQPCAHAAAAVYAAGCLIDSDPLLLFTLRSIEPASLMSAPAPVTAEASFDTAALAATFGIDIDLD